MATAAQLLDGEAFNQLVLEEGLKTWEQEGYVYAGKRGKKGWELYRAYGPKWCYLYQSRRTNTQANVGGGILHTRVSLASGVVGQLVEARAVLVCVGAVAIASNLLDEDSTTVVPLSAVAAAANNNTNLPSIGATAGTTNNLINSVGLKIGPGQYLDFFAGTVAQNETLTVAITLLLPITATAADVVWDTTNSGGTPTLADSTINAANTMQAVLLP